MSKYSQYKNTYPSDFIAKQKTFGVRRLFNPEIRQGGERRDGRFSRHLGNDKDRAQAYADLQADMAHRKKLARYGTHTYMHEIDDRYDSNSQHVIQPDVYRMFLETGDSLRRRAPIDVFLHSRKTDPDLIQDMINNANELAAKEAEDEE